MSPFLPYFLDMSLQFFSNLFVFLSHVTLLHEAEAWFLSADIMGHVGWIPVGVCLMVGAQTYSFSGCFNAKASMQPGGWPFTELPCWAQLAAQVGIVPFGKFFLSGAREERGVSIAPAWQEPWPTLHPPHPQPQPSLGLLLTLGLCSLVGEERQPHWLLQAGAF